MSTYEFYKREKNQIRLSKERQNFENHGFHECDTEESKNIWKDFARHSKFQPALNQSPGFVIYPSSPCVYIDTHEFTKHYGINKTAYDKNETLLRQNTVKILSYLESKSAHYWIFSVNHQFYRFRPEDVSDKFWPYDILSPFNFVVIANSDCTIGFFSSPYGGLTAYGFEYEILPSDHKYHCEYHVAK